MVFIRLVPHPAGFPPVPHRAHPQRAADGRTVRKAGDRPRQPAPQIRFRKYRTHRREALRCAKGGTRRGGMAGRGQHPRGRERNFCRGDPARGRGAPLQTFKPGRRRARALPRPAGRRPEAKGGGAFKAVQKAQTGGGAILPPRPAVYMEIICFLSIRSSCRRGGGKRNRTFRPQRRPYRSGCRPPCSSSGSRSRRACGRRCSCAARCNS